MKKQLFQSLAFCIPKANLRLVAAVAFVVAAGVGFLGQSGGGTALAQGAGIGYWVFEDVAAVPPIPNCGPIVRVNGYDVDPADRPVISWSESSGCGGTPKVYWSRKDADLWPQTTFEPNKLYPGGADSDFAHEMALAPDGTPWMVFDAIVGEDFYSWRTDLNADPTGANATRFGWLSGYRSCMYGDHAIAFAPSGTLNSVRFLNSCDAFRSRIILNGTIIADSLVWINGGDYAMAPDGSHHILYSDAGTVRHSDGSGRGMDVTWIERFSGDVQIEADATGMLHAVIRGYGGNDLDNGVMGYLTSIDGGTTWSAPEMFDTTHASLDVTLALDRNGVPAVTFWRWNSELWYASRAGGAWTFSRVLGLPSRTGRPRLAFDFANNPSIAFFDSSAARVRLAHPAAPVNRPPTVTNPGNQTSAEGTSVSLQISASDPDGDAVTYSATGLPPGLSINATTGLITGTLGFTTAGTYLGVMVSVADGKGGTASASFTWTVTDVNRPPAVTNPGNQTSAEGTSVSLAVTATDPDGDSLTFSASGLPPGLSIDGTGLISGSLGYSAAGAYPVTVTVTDGKGGSASASFTWTVTDVNRPPAVPNPGNQTSAEGTTVSLQITASDPDGDAMTYSASGLPPGLSIDATTGVISGSLSYTAAGTYNPTVTVTDAKAATGSTSFTWTVTDVNRPPAVTNPGNQTSAEGTAVSLAISASDSDGDALTYSATGLPPGLSIDGTGVISGSLGYSAAGTYAVTVTVTDGKGGSASAGFTWTVTDVNRPPAVTNPGNQTSAEGTSVSLAVTATDPDGDSLTFSASGLPPGLSIGATTGLISGSLGYSAAGAYPVTVTVTDGKGGSASASFTWTVTDVNRPPALAPVGNKTVVAGTLLTFTLSASDPDGGLLTFGATGLPAGASLNASTGAFSWTPGAAQVGSYPVTFRVTDPGGLSASEMITITVTQATAQNHDPICVSARPSLSEIWPPNHRLVVPISILGVTDPDGDAVTITITRILQDEPTNTLGDGTTWIDGFGVGTSVAQVRAERSGTPRVPGNGRVYEISFTASDGKGGTCSGAVLVGVPHDQGTGPAVDDGIRYDSTVAGGPRLR